MDAQAHFRSLLESRFDELRAQYPNYSLRRFAKELDQNPAALSQIFSGKRKVSPKFAFKIGEKLGLPRVQFEKLTKSFQADIGSLDYNRVSISPSQYDLVAEWQYYAILCLLETRDFKSDLAWIAQRLKISPTLAKTSIQRLERLGLLSRDEAGQLHLNQVNLTTSDGTKNLALRHRHEKNLEQARQSLLLDAVESRDFSFVTMAIDPDKIPEARRKIRQFLNSMSEFLESGTKSEVYEVCVQMFPRTQINQSVFEENHVQ